jgi:hypothetical protein
MSMNRLLAWGITRFAVLTIFASSLQRDLFVPFLSNPNLHLLDPWSSWVELQGRLDAFPYGIVMFLFFLPAILLSYIFEQLPIFIDFSILVGCTLLVAEYFMLKLVQVFDKVSPRVWSWSISLLNLFEFLTKCHPGFGLGL